MGVTAITAGNNNSVALRGVALCALWYLFQGYGFMS